MAAALVTTATTVAPAQAADRVYGVVLPPNSRPIADEHYRSPLSYDKTLRFFSRTYGRRDGVIWRPIRGNPSVKGVHIINNRRGRTWDAINVYESRRAVYMYVIGSKTAKTTKKKRRKKR